MSSPTEATVTPLKRDWRGSAPSSVVAYWREHDLEADGAMAKFEYGEGRDIGKERSYRKKLKQRMRKVVEAVENVAADPLSTYINVPVSLQTGEMRAEALDALWPPGKFSLSGFPAAYRKLSPKLPDA